MGGVRARRGPGGGGGGGGGPTPMGAQAEGLYAMFDRLGYGDKDFSGVLQLMRGHLDELDAEARGGR